MDTQSPFNQINILYYALLGGQVLFCLVLLFGLSDPGARETGWPEAPFGLLAPILLAGIIPFVFYLNKRQLSQAAEQPDLSAKINHYRNTVILRSALIEGTNLFCLVMFLMENNINYLVLFAGGLLLFWYFRPSADEFTRHYQLNGAEKMEFDRL